MKPLNYVWITLAVSLLLLSSCQTSPADDDHVKVVTKQIVEGDNLLIVCNTTHVNDKQDFFWIKNSTDGDTSTLYGSGWTLEIVSISRRASAIYICHALDTLTGENVTMSATKVDVQYPTECLSMSLGPQVIYANGTYDVGCSMHGNPTPYWGIFNNDTGQSIFSARASADIYLMGNPVKCGDSGYWVCTGYNELNKGVNATRGYQLTVLCSPRPDPNSRIVLNHKATLHDNVVMTVDVKSDPPASFKWSRDDGKSFGDVIKNGTTLSLHNVAYTDFGKYTLRMNNSIGSYDAHFTLHTYGYPEKPYSLRASKITYQSVYLSWTSGYDMGTTQSFTILQFVGNTNKTLQYVDGPYKNGGIGQKWHFHLKYLQGDTQYTIAVLAKNLENSTLSDKIMFNTTSSPDVQAPAVALIVGSVTGAVVFLIVAVAIAGYVYKISRRSYTVPLTLKGKEPIIGNSGTNDGHGGTYVVNDGTKQRF